MNIFRIFGGSKTHTNRGCSDSAICDEKLEISTMRKPDYRVSKKRIFLQGLRLGLVMVLSLMSPDLAWAGVGQSNHHFAMGQNQITKDNISSLQHAWAFDANLHTPLSPLVGGVGPLLWATNAGITSKATLSDDGILYFGDTAGGLYAIDSKTGNIVWQDYMPDFSTPDMPVSGVYAQPTVSGSVLYVGSNKIQTAPLCTSVSGPFCQENKGAIVMAINRLTGALIWKVKVDSHNASKIKGGITVSGNQLIVPVSSWEEVYTDSGNKTYVTGDPADANSPYPCCSFRGSVVALDKNTGAILWKTYTVPGNNVPAGILESGEKGFYGNAVWLENPIVDNKRGRVYVATGNNYTVPKKAQLCALHLQDPADYAAPTLPTGFTCENLNTKIGNYQDAILALDLKTGAIVNFFQQRKYDSWVEACSRPNFSMPNLQPILGLGAVAGSEKNCPTIEDPNNPGKLLSIAGPDTDFAAISFVPRIFIENDTQDTDRNDDKIKVDLLIAADKGGTLYALDADKFSLVWKTKVGPGGIIGGFVYDFATDGRYVYLNNINSANSGLGGTQPRFSQPFYGTKNEPDTFYNPIAPGYYSGFDFNYFGTPQAYSGSGFGLIANIEGETVEPDNTMINSGKRDWALINPPIDPNYPLVDGIATYLDGTTIRTRTSFFSKVDISNGRIVWQRPVPTYGYPPIQSPWMNSVLDPTHTIAYQGCMSIPTLVNGMLIVNCGLEENSLDGGLIAMDTDTGKIITIIHGISISLQNNPIVDGKSIFIPTGVPVGMVFNPDFLNMFYGFPGTFGGIDVRSHKLYKLELPN